ncbi:transporter [Oryzibacter oryziterrae]|uniref:transporter n=1 Tax=Oryzibacter oryziterrae TaxID=2766474 RepID=UPI001F35498A|nr:transporter [Oryzibacter oryziterrae]
MLNTEIPGFVWAYRFDGTGSKGVALPASTKGLDLVVPEGFVWLHLALSDARVPKFLESIAGLPVEARATLTDRDTHVTLATDEGVLHGVFTDLERAFDYETHDIGWFRFAVTGRLIITARLHPLRCIEATRLAVERGLSLREPVEVFESIVREFERVVDGLVADMRDELDTIEDYVFEVAPRDERRRLGPVRRTVVRLNRQLRASISLLRRVGHDADSHELPAGSVDMAERLVEYLGPVYQEIQSLQDRARLLHEEIDSKISSETNRHLYILSVMTAFMLPPTLVTGFFGMNTGGLPFAGEHFGTFLAFVLGCASVGGAWWFLKRAGIL